MFDSQRHRSGFEAVGGLLCELFGEIVASQSDPVFYVPAGSSIVAIGVLPFEGEEMILDVRAVVTQGSEHTHDLLEYLLRANAESEGFGAFALETDGTITYGAQMLVSHATTRSLALLVSSAADIADQYDDQIVAKWGGLRAADVFDTLRPGHKGPLGFCTDIKT